MKILRENLLDIFWTAFNEWEKEELSVSQTFISCRREALKEYIEGIQDGEISIQID